MMLPSLPPPVNETAGTSQAARGRPLLRLALFVTFLSGGTVAGYFAIPQQEPATPPPGLHAEPVVARVGEQGQGELVPVEFRLTNHDAEPVEIYSVVTSCGCLVPSVSRKHLAAGQETTISLQWYTGSARGPVAQSIWVYHSIPGNPPEEGGRMQLRIEGEVVPDIQVQPTSVQFTATQAGSARVVLSPGRLPSFMVRQVYANSPALSAKYLPESSAVEITYTPKGELDTGAGLHVAVETSSKTEPTIHVPVKVVRLEQR